MDESGSKYLYLTSLSDAIEKHDKSVREFLEGQSPEALLAKTFTVREVNALVNNFDGVQRLKLVPPELASLYWGYWYRQGSASASSLVLALTIETLQRRLDNAFGIIKTPAEYEQATRANYDNFRATSYNLEEYKEVWKPLRQRLAESHGGFQYTCQAKRWQPWRAHNQASMSLTINVYTAKQFRELCLLIDGNLKVGLNHLDFIYDVKVMTEFKLAFPGVHLPRIDSNDLGVHTQHAIEIARERCPSY
jgi:hypothetical protein